MFASLSGSQLKQAFVLTGSFADRYPGVGPEGLPQESRSRCPEPRQETPWSWARQSVSHTEPCAGQEDLSQIKATPEEVQEQSGGLDGISQHS